MKLNTKKVPLFGNIMVNIIDFLLYCKKKKVRILSSFFLPGSLGELKIELGIDCGQPFPLHDANRSGWNSCAEAVSYSSSLGYVTCSFSLY